MKEQLEHIWARNTDPNAMKRRGNVSFTGMRAFSWSTVIACKYPNKTGDGGVCVIAHNGIHNSGYTMQHKSGFRSALPQGWTTIDVDLKPINMSTYSLGGALADIKGLRECYDYMKFPLADMADAIRKAKSYGSRATKWKELSRYIHNLNKLAEFLKRKPISMKALGLDEGEETANLMKWNVSVASRQEPKPRAYTGGSTPPELPEYIDQWRSGKRRKTPYTWYNTYLRLSKDKTRVETSRGAVVPVEDAIKLFDMCTFMLEKGYGVNTVGKNVRVGPYLLESITELGDCQVGCHTLRYGEMKRLNDVYKAIKKG